MSLVLNQDASTPVAMRLFPRRVQNILTHLDVLQDVIDFQARHNVLLTISGPLTRLKTLAKPTSFKIYRIHYKQLQINIHLSFKH